MEYAVDSAFFGRKMQIDLQIKKVSSERNNDNGDVKLCSNEQRETVLLVILILRLFDKKYMSAS